MASFYLSFSFSSHLHSHHCQTHQPHSCHHQSMQQSLIHFIQLLLHIKILHLHILTQIHLSQQPSFFLCPSFSFSSSLFSFSLVLPYNFHQSLRPQTHHHLLLLHLIHPHHQHIHNLLVHNQLHFLHLLQLFLPSPFYQHLLLLPLRIQLFYVLLTFSF